MLRRESDVEERFETIKVGNVELRFLVKIEDGKLKYGMIPEDAVRFQKLWTYQPEVFDKLLNKVEELQKRLEKEKIRVKIENKIENHIKNGESGIETIIQSLADKNWQVRVATTEALVKIGKTAIQPLIQALKNDNANIRYRAAEVLGNIGDKNAVEYLIPLLNDEYPTVQGIAEKALNKLGWSPSTKK